MLAFGKYNGRPITIFLKSLFENIWSPSVYVFGPKVQGKKRSVEISPLPRPEIKLTLKMPDFEGLKGLWQKINTTKTAIPHREKPLPSQTEPFGGFSKERYEAVRHITGEREIAKRVDYR
ncbi:MAG: hypothetical protein A2Y84_00860 [Candidatus Colwellbacteria bacterium RBG_13_48_8]|uniref:Uncharacterized protein n=1 Tax=Candidatus Colwellbacteria bacterium RBG_13_48_8 TaxID=1797685 RepID=A0A1G1YUV6_9BACT|nr:MAG: hypothetical protein A2Y84_00860 [Candidatus Colwellbacteria bacterium RBG_13_48_8]